MHIDTNRERAASQTSAGLDSSHVPAEYRGSVLLEIDAKSPAWRTRILHDLPIQFAPGLNILAGPNGSGKSTVLNLLLKSARAEFAAEVGAEVRTSGRVVTRYLDGTTSVRQHSDWAPAAVERAIQTASHFQSHGQTSDTYLRALEELIEEFCSEKEEKGDEAGEGLCILLDEPDSLGLDFDNAVKCRELLMNGAARGVQSVVATHSLLLWRTPGAHLIVLGENKRYAEDVCSRFGLLCGGYDTSGVR